ncbi:hypothetical protein ACM66B_004452 [Microbotryomycetes sp. NB124-2]
MPPKLTQPLRPVARYRKGKGVQPAVDSDSDDQDQDEQQQQHEQQAQDEQDEDITSFGGVSRQHHQNAQIKVALNDKPPTSSKQQAEDSSEYETDSEEEQKPPPKPVFNKPQAVQKATVATAAAEESSEYETESESEEEQPKILFKPVFVSKRNRDTVQEAQKALDPDKQEEQRIAELQERKKQSQNLIAETIMRELAEKDAEDKVPDVDDTDGLDPEGEFEAWKLRELKRIKRDKEARYAREKEREEVEARRALPEQLRLKEDLEHAKKTREEKKKGQQAFLQKYHHKGAFYSDLDILKKHDYTAPTESTNVSMDLLPKAMQNKNFGKRSQSKYTHLAAEDTSDKQAGWAARRGVGVGGGAGSGKGDLVCFHCGGPHMKRDCPQLAAGGDRERDSGYDGRRAPRRGDDDYDDRRGGGYREYGRAGRYDGQTRRDDDRRRSRSPPGGGGARRSGLGYGDRRDDRARSDDRRRDYAGRDDRTRQSDLYDRDDRKRSDERRTRHASDDGRDERDDKRRRV